MLSHVIKMQSQIYIVEYDKTHMRLYRIIDSMIFESTVDVNIVLNHFWKLNFKIKHIRGNKFLVSNNNFTKLDTYIKSNKIIYWQYDIYEALNLDRPIRLLYENFLKFHGHLIHSVFDNYNMIPTKNYRNCLWHKIFIDESYYNFKE